MSERTFTTPNGVIIRVYQRRRYADVFVSTCMTNFNFRDPEQVLKQCEKYRSKRTTMMASSTGLCVFNVKAEKVEFLIDRISNFLLDSENLVEIEAPM